MSERVFSSGASRATGEPGVEGLAASAPAPVSSAASDLESSRKGRGAAVSGSAPAAVYFSARRCYGNTGMYATLELPRCVEVARYPTVEAAQAYALALNEWLARRPTPDTVAPFFESSVRAEPGWPELQRILDGMLKPEMA